jgi:hypothetical protein
MATPAGRESVRRIVGSDAHPVQTFYVENLEVMSLLSLAAAVLLLAVGIGVVRRRPWALPLGAAFLALGGLRQGAALAVAWGKGAPLLSGDGEVSTIVVIGAHLLSLTWLAFLLWYFSRPVIRREFTAERV